MLRPTHLGVLLSWRFKCLSRHLAGGGVLRLDNEDCTLLQQTIDLLEDMRPREICAGIRGAPVVIFTDGAHEEDDCLTTHGAVMIDPSSGLHLFLRRRNSSELRRQVASRWQTTAGGPSRGAAGAGRQSGVGQAPEAPQSDMVHRQ